MTKQITATNLSSGLVSAGKISYALRPAGDTSYGSEVNTGITEVAGSTGEYTASIADDFYGTIRWTEWTEYGVVAAAQAFDETRRIIPGGIGAGAISSTEAPNLDAAVSSRAALGDAMTLTADYDAAKTAAQVGSAMTLESAERDAVATALLDLANAIDGKTPRQALRIIAAVMAGKVSGAGSGMETFRSLDDANDRVVVTVDALGNRTNVAYQ
ncbi:MAG: hypothetical protein ACWGMZ_04665 [Thermoguttaceae bacterium]